MDSKKNIELEWFNLVWLFYCISTFVGYLMPKQAFYKDNRGTI